MKYFKVLVVFLLVAVIYSCTTSRNSVVNRTYHNITARFNGLYYADESVGDGIYKIEKSHKDNFDKLLPIYIYPNSEKAKATFPEFDRAIKKSSFCIQRHTIKDSKKNEVASAGKYIDNCWIDIGISCFYKKEYYTALENLEYVARTYTKSKDKFVAIMWMIKINNEIGAVSISEQYLSLLKNEKNLPKEVKKELPILEADYYSRKGLNTESSSRLMGVIRNNNPFTGINRKKRARYSFIVAQLLEENKDNKRAAQYYKKTIALKPNYDLVFYSKIKLARLLDVKRSSSEKTKKDLLRMSKEFKNNEYYDVIFYTLGEIEEKERNQDKAEYYYRKSVRTSVNNPQQKAASFLKLGEINFEQTHYQPAEAYYDSALVTLPKDHNQYNSILARKKTLEALVKEINTIAKEDSIQRISKMSEADLNKFIDELIIREERIEAQKEAEKNRVTDNGFELANNGFGQPQNGSGLNPSTQGALFYFYNPQTVAFGINDFQRKWGNRPLEDDWRRSNKALSVVEKTEENDTSSKKAVATTKKKDRDSYKKNLLKSDSAIRKSDTKIINAFYSMGNIYKEELNNTKKAVAAFEELNTRYPKNKYLLNTYYILYRTNQAEKREDKAEYYKNKILTEFPESEFALLLKNPNMAEELNAKKSEVESFYIPVYQSYIGGDYTKALQGAGEGLKKYGKTEFSPKFEFIKALSLGKIKSVDSMETGLKLLVANYPKSEITPQANDILLAIKKQKNPELFASKVTTKINLSAKDTFQVNLDTTHYIIAQIPDDPKIANAFKNSLDVFCVKNYALKSFNMSTTLYGQAKQLVLLKGFKDAKESKKFYDDLMGDKDMFKGEVKKEVVEIFPILYSNLPYLYKYKNLEAYTQFYKDYYSDLKP